MAVSTVLSALLPCVYPDLTQYQPTRWSKSSLMGFSAPPPLFLSVDIAGSGDPLYSIRTGTAAPTAGEGQTDNR